MEVKACCGQGESLDIQPVSIIIYNRIGYIYILLAVSQHMCRLYIVGKSNKYDMNNLYFIFYHPYAIVL